MIWSFEINGVQVEEPINWDSISFNLQRSDQFNGLENIFTDELTFIDQGAAILKNAYDTDGIDAQLQLLIKYKCDYASAFKIAYFSVINLITYSIENGEVTVQLDDNIFHRKFINRLDIPINFHDADSIGGVAIPSANMFELGLHSKAIIEQGEFELNTFLDDQSDNGVNIGGNNRIYFPLQTKIDEIGGLIDLTNLFDLSFSGTNPTPVFVAPIAGTYKFQYNFAGEIRESTNAGFRQNNYFLKYTIRNGGTFITQGDLATPTTYTGTNGTISMPFNVAGEISFGLNANDEVSFYNFIQSSPNRSSDLRYLTSASSLRITTESIYKPSTCQAILLWDAFNRCAQGMTDQVSCFKSDFFSIDCGKWVSTTNGKNIRKLQQADGTQYPLIMSFNELYAAASAVFNIGLRIEVDDYGRSTIRIEEKSFFYNSSSILILDNISDLKKTPAVDLMNNEFEAGYQKWNLNIAGINGLDEVNGTRNYSLPVLNAKKKLSFVSTFIASGYVIEQTRRLQFASNPTTDFETDNDNFFICTNTSEITSDKYSDPPLMTTYQAGIISERDENFTSISNLLSPSTIYNLRITPFRNILNWWNVIKVSLDKKVNPVAKFISGEGNYFEGDDEVYACDKATAKIFQNLNVQNSILDDPSALHKGSYLEFSYPLTYDQFLQLIKYSNRSIDVTCSDGNFTKGYIKEVKYQPNVDGGIANFKLIEGDCVLGGFDTGFDSGFDIGTC